MKTNFWIMYGVPAFLVAGVGIWLVFMSWGNIIMNGEIKPGIGDINIIPLFFGIFLVVISWFSFRKGLKKSRSEPN